MLRLIHRIDIRRSVLIAFMISLPACGNMALPNGSDNQHARDLLAFQQSINSQSTGELTTEASVLREQLERRDNPATQLRLQMVEQRLDHLAALESERQQQQSLRREIQSLAEQIQALTAIEQQINQREQRQENSNGAR